MSGFRIFISALIGITVCLSNSALAAPRASFQLNSYRASYVVKYDGIPFGKSVTDLRILPAAYQLCITNTPTLPLLHGEIQECSSGLRHQQQIMPLRYRYDYINGKEVQHLVINFNWQMHQADIAVNGQHWHTKLLPGTQDKISYQLMLREGLATHQKTFTFPVADGGKIKLYHFVVIGTPTIQTRWRQVKSILLERLPMPGKEKLRLWLAPELNNMVVKVEQQKHFADIGTAELVKYDAHF